MSGERPVRVSSTATGDSGSQASQLTRQLPHGCQMAMPDAGMGHTQMHARTLRYAGTYNRTYKHMTPCAARCRAPRYHAHRDRKARLQVVVLDKRPRKLGLRSVLEDELHDREDDGHQAIEDEEQVDV